MARLQTIFGHGRRLVFEGRSKVSTGARSTRVVAEPSCGGGGVLSACAAAGRAWPCHNLTAVRPIQDPLYPTVRLLEMETKRTTDSCENW